MGEASEAGWGDLTPHPWVCKDTSALDPEYPARENTVLGSLSCSREMAVSCYDLKVTGSKDKLTL